MTFAYARVSAADQNLNRQIDSFIQFGVSRRKIFSDKKSGKDFERTGYNKLLKKMKKVVTITNVICYNELYWNFCSLKDTTI